MGVPTLPILAALLPPVASGAAFALSRVAVYLMYKPQTSTSGVHKKPIIPDDVALSRWRSWAIGVGLCGCLYEVLQ